MDPVRNEQLVSVISGLGEWDVEELQALWQQLAPGEPAPQAHDLLRALQMRLAQRV